MEKIKAKRSFKSKLLVATIIPLVILSVISAVVSGYTLKKNLTSQVEDNLSDLAKTMVNEYGSAFDGDYNLNSEGKLCKGKQVISDYFDLIDNNRNSTGVEFTMFFGDTRYLTSLKDVTTGERIIGTKAGEQVINTVLKQGKEYFAENITINNTQYFGYYVPIKNSDGSVAGMMFTGRTSAEVNSMIMNNLIFTIAITVVILIAAIIFMLLWAGNISKSLKDVTGSLVDIAEGRLTKPVSEKAQAGNDEIGLIAQSAEQLRASLYNIITEIAKNTGELNDSVQDIDNIAAISHDSTNAVNQAMDELATATMHHAESTQNANVHMTEMSGLIEDIAADVISLTSNAKNMDQVEKNAAANLEDVTKYILTTMDAVERIAKQADITNDAAKKIGAAVNIISSIAEETTLLSLNASIESARAGELGKGFGVVASQIQKLADQSSESASDIESSVNELLSESSKTVSVMAEVKEIVAQQKLKIEETQGNFDILAKNVGEAVSSINAIKGQTESLRDHRGQMNDIIAELSALSEENAASTQETTATIGELDTTIANMATNSKLLSEISNTLRLHVNEFEV